MTVQAVSGERTRKRSMRRKKHPWLRRTFRLISVIAAVIVLSIITFRFINPPITPVMLAEKLRGHTLRREWVPLKDMSRQLPIAAISSEDGRFCAHWGVDWSAVKEAIDEGGGLRAFRGASTIPMQTAKNLYLWSGRSYVRKAIEVPLAYVMSALWPKARMMEVYLNVAQFGRGIFGRGCKPLLFQKECGRPHPPRGGPSGRGAAEPAFQEPGEAKPAHAAGGTVDRAPAADHGPTLGVRFSPAVMRTFVLAFILGQPERLPL